MALRLMQVMIPADAESELKPLLEGCDILTSWCDDSEPARLIVQLQLPAEKSEALMDDLEECFEEHEDFQLLLLPLEAVLPHPTPEDDTAPNTNGYTGSDSLKETIRVSREELYSNLGETLGVNRAFIAMILLSTVVAAVGLIQNDVAVIIGAMVIAPLLGPNVAMSLSATLADRELFLNALRTAIAGTAVALLASVLIGLGHPVTPDNPAIAARSDFNYSDIILALAAGSAGTFAFTRGQANAVIGVMVAVALIPPLVACGLLLGSGHFSESAGALVLVLTNIICINLAGILTFIFQGVRPRRVWESKRAEKARRYTLAIWLVLLVLLLTLGWLTRQLPDLFG
ncbi:TIGR00341 family protein [Ferrimonas gelatinilytica]|uniref:TIGR00341 family protein n=1 Tax=Ferrimonas gelatinilytica TaxID=1255257 RepID=A0ABP9RST8_9GAMM